MIFGGRTYVALTANRSTKSKSCKDSGRLALCYISGRFCRSLHANHETA
jgi:hypothetical protein